MLTQRQSGFTLIELVIVIVVLGILAATALPRFVNLTEDAKVAGVKGVAGALGSAVNLAHAQWLADGSQVGADITMNGQTVNMNDKGWPQGNSEANCENVWNHTMNNPPALGTDYQVAYASTDCQYSYADDTTYKIQYDDQTGSVTTVLPSP